MTKKQIEDTCEKLVTPIIEEFGCELVDVEYVKEGATYYLRVYADKEGGITIDDCVDITKKLNPKLDEYEKEFKDAYILEVSSPGLLRPLKKDKDFKKERDLSEFENKNEDESNNTIVDEIDNQDEETKEE